MKIVLSLLLIVGMVGCGTSDPVDAPSATDRSTNITAKREPQHTDTQSASERKTGEKRPIGETPGHEAQDVSTKNETGVLATAQEVAASRGIALPSDPTRTPLSTLPPIRVVAAGNFFAFQGQSTTRSARKQFFVDSFGKIDEITVKGKPITYGLWAHPIPRRGLDYSEIRYQVAGRYKRLEGSVAIRDGVTPASRLTFVIVGDDKELWRSQPLKTAAVVVPFDVKLDGVKDLRLLVHCPGRNNWAHSIWLNPTLTRAQRDDAREPVSSRAEIYLSEIAPDAVLVCDRNGWGFGNFGRVGNSEETRITVKGQAFVNGIGAHPEAGRRQSLLHYTLGRRFSILRGAVALNDSTRRPASPVTFQIIGNGQVLWQSQEIDSVGVSQRFQIDVKKVDSLQMKVKCAADNTACSAAWLDPVLERSTSARTGSSPDSVSGVKAGTVAARQKAEISIKQLFKDDYRNAKSPMEKMKFARKLLQHANESIDDPISRYVLLCQSRDFAIAAGVAKTALQAVDELVAHFQVEPLEEKRDVLVKVTKTARSPLTARALAVESLHVLDEAISVDRYSIALRLCRVASESAKKARDPDLVKLVIASQKHVARLQQQQETASAAISDLKTNPNNENANLALGKFLCQKDKDWKAALGHLAKGADHQLATLATSDLATPSIPVRQVQLADTWWDYSTTQPSPFRELYQQRAVHWYERALPRLMGLKKSRVVKRLDTISNPTRNAWRFSTVKSWVGELHKLLGAGALDHPKCPDELLAAFKNGKGRIGGVGRHDGLNIDGTGCGWFGKALTWSVSRPSLINAQLMITTGLDSRLGNSDLCFFDSTGRDVGHLHLNGLPGRLAVSVRYDILTSQVLVSATDNDGRVAATTQFPVDWSKSLHIALAGCVRRPGQTFDLQLSLDR